MDARSAPRGAVPLDGDGQRVCQLAAPARVVARVLLRCANQQDTLVIDIDQEKLESRMSDYFDPSLSDQQLAHLHPGAMDGSNACEPISTRAGLLRRGYLSQYLVPILSRPFDQRWIY